MEEQTQGFQNFLGGYLYVFVEYLRNRSPEMRKKINDFILILAIFTLLINDEAKIRHFFTANCALKYIIG